MIKKDYHGFSYEWSYCGPSSLQKVKIPELGQKFLQVVDPDESLPADEPCPTCDGNGWVYDEEDGGTMTCPDCGGDG